MAFQMRRLGNHLLHLSFASWNSFVNFWSLNFMSFPSFWFLTTWPLSILFELYLLLPQILLGMWVYFVYSPISIAQTLQCHSISFQERFLLQIHIFQGLHCYLASIVKESWLWRMKVPGYYLPVSMPLYNSIPCEFSFFIKGLKRNWLYADTLCFSSELF